MKLRKKEMIEGVMYTGDNDTIRNFVNRKAK